MDTNGDDDGGVVDLGFVNNVCVGTTVLLAFDWLKF